jgi:hypothetical protein
MLGKIHQTHMGTVFFSKNRIILFKGHFVTKIQIVVSRDIVFQGGYDHKKQLRYISDRDIRYRRHCDQIKDLRRDNMN